MIAFLFVTIFVTTIFLYFSTFSAYNFIEKERQRLEPAFAPAEDVSRHIIRFDVSTSFRQNQERMCFLCRMNK